jgi:hypothetical protein
VAEGDHADAFGLRHAREVGDRDAGQRKDRIDVVELQRIDQKVKPIGGWRDFARCSDCVLGYC